MRLLRNVLFAKYGKTFETEWNQNYFEGNSWYHPAGYTANVSPDPYYSRTLLNCA